MNRLLGSADNLSRAARSLRALSCLLLLIGGTQAGAATPYTCVDESGKKSFQDHPCGTRPAYAGNPKFSIPGKPASAAAQRNGKICWTDPCKRGFQYGSVKYRECRSTEAQRLEDQCLYLRREDAKATGERQDSLNAAIEACCSAYEKYEIDN